MFTMKNPELSQSVENKNRLLKYARNAAAVGALATVAVLAVPGAAQAEEVSQTPAATAEASPTPDTTATAEPTPEVSAEPTPEASDTPEPEPTEPDTTDLDNVIGTPPPATIEGGGKPAPVENIIDDSDMDIPEPSSVNNPTELPRTGFSTEKGLETAAVLGLAGAGVLLVERGTRKPTDIQLPTPGPEAPVQ
jgi:hypothetical protein